jgi:hypothetical protein
MELETLLLIMTRLYIPMDEVKSAFEMVWELDRMLSGLTKRLKELPVAA